MKLYPRENIRWQIGGVVILLMLLVIMAQQVFTQNAIPIFLLSDYKAPVEVTNLIRLGASQAVMFLFALGVLVYMESRGKLAFVPRFPLLCCIIVGGAFAAATFPIGSLDMYDYITFGRKLGMLHRTPYAPRYDAMNDPVIGVLPSFWYGAPSPYGPVANLLYAFLNIITPVNVTWLAIVFKVTWFYIFLTFIWLFHSLTGHSKTLPYSRWFAICANPMFCWLCLRDAHIELLIMVWLTLCLLALRKQAWFRTGIMLGLVCSTKIVMLGIVPFFIWYAFSTADTRVGLTRAKQVALGFLLWMVPLYAAFSGAELKAVSDVATTSYYCPQVIPMNVQQLLNDPPLAIHQPAEFITYTIRIANLCALAALAWLFLGVARTRKPFNLPAIAGAAMACVFITRSYLMPWYVLWSFLLLVIGSTGAFGMMAVTTFFTLLIAPNNYCAASHFTQLAIVFAGVACWIHYMTRAVLKNGTEIAGQD